VELPVSRSSTLTGEDKGDGKPHIGPRATSRVIEWNILSGMDEGGPQQSATNVFVQLYARR